MGSEMCIRDSPDSLQAKLEEWKQLWPNDSRGTNRMFGPFNHCSILAGMDYLPSQSLPALEFVNHSHAEQYFSRVEARGQQLKASMPTQAEYFRQLARVNEFRTAEW